MDSGIQFKNRTKPVTCEEALPLLCDIHDDANAGDVVAASAVRRATTHETLMNNQTL